MSSGLGGADVTASGDCPPALVGSALSLLPRCYLHGMILHQTLSPVTLFPSLLLVWWLVEEGSWTKWGVNKREPAGSCYPFPWFCMAYRMTMVFTFVNS